MEKIVEACLSGEIPLEIACIIASQPEAGGLVRAKKLGITDQDITVVNPKDFLENGLVNQEKFGEVLVKVLENHAVDIVSQNGWLPMTPKNVIDRYRGNIFNQHPGPKKETRATYGIQPHAIMLFLCQKTNRNLGTEVIIHRVNENWDDGETVARAEVPILDIQESPETLQKRALEYEHALQIDFLKKLTNCRIEKVTNEKKYLLPEESGFLKAARRLARKNYPHG